MGMPFFAHLYAIKASPERGDGFAEGEEVEVFLTTDRSGYAVRREAIAAIRRGRTLAGPKLFVPPVPQRAT